MTSRFQATLAACLAVAALASAAAAQQMPDPALMHGRALPAPELADGTVTVRVVREAVGNDLPGVDVSVVAGETTRTATTDDLGRAEFSDLPGGATAQARTVVDGEELVSQPFPVPRSGGLRVILVAGLAEAAERRAREAAEAAAAAVPGTVVFGGESRILVRARPDDESLDVYYVLDILNSTSTTVDVGGPVIVDLPRGAGGAEVLEGSTPAATVSGDRVIVLGPFAPGTTPVRIGYRLRYGSRDATVRQAWPAAMQQVTVFVEQLGNLRLSSAQLAAVNDVRAEDGQPYVVGSGPSLAAGAPLEMTISNLPLYSRTPRYVALGLAAGLLVLGAWLAFTARPGSATADMATLTARRDALLDEGAALEGRLRSGAIDKGRYDARRRRIIAELEQIYARIDDAQAGSAGSGAGAAA